MDQLNLLNIYLIADTEKTCSFNRLLTVTDGIQRENTTVHIVLHCIYGLILLVSFYIYVFIFYYYIPIFLSCWIRVVVTVHFPCGG